MTEVVSLLEHNDRLERPIPTIDLMHEEEEEEDKQQVLLNCPSQRIMINIHTKHVCHRNFANNVELAFFRKGWRNFTKLEADFTREV